MCHLLIPVADLEKLEGGSKEEKAKQQGSGGHSPPDTEGYFQFNTTFVPGFCIYV